MARKKPTDDDESSGMSSDVKLLKELRDRFKKCVAADRENRRKYRENMKFALVPGEQWDKASKDARGDARPMFEFNEIRIKGKAIVNQIRANRPSAKIAPAEDGDIQLAEVMKAEIDQIQNACDGDAIQDYAAHHQVFGGMGAERYVTVWNQESVDKQDIVIEPIQNPMCLYPDHACKKQDKSDARYWILATKMQKDIFKETYKNAKPVDFDFDDGFEDDCTEDEVWIAEYWKQKPTVRQLALLSDGKTVDLATIKQLPAGVTIVKRRNAPGYEIVQYICSGDAVLTSEELDPETGEPVQVKEHKWAGIYFPFNIVYGEYTVIDGKVHWSGITEFGKDGQRAHNWAGTSFFEAIAAAPQGTTWVTEEQAKDLLPEWLEAQKKNIHIKRYNFDPRVGGPPKEEPASQIPTALVSAFQMSSDIMKAVLGMPDEALGEKGSTNSGIAIRRRQEAGAVANYNYGDNIVNFIRNRYKILIDLIPKVKDTAYTIRVLGKDGAEKTLRINDIDPVTGQKLNDLSSIKYDLVVTQGPNFATQRQEAAETYMGLSHGNPGLMAVAGDLIVGSLDLPKAQEIAERLKATLPPTIQAMLNKDQPQDPRVVAAMQEVEAAMAQVQEQQALVQQAAQEAQSEQQDASKAKSEVQVAAANLKVQEAQLALKEAQLDTAVAEFQRMVAEQQAKDASEQIGKSEQNAAESSDQRDAILQHVQQIIEQLSMGAGLIAQTQQQQIDNLRGLVEPPPPPVVESKQARTVKENGGYTTTIDGESGSQQVRTEKGPDGELVTVAGDRILTTKREGNSFVTTVTPVTMQ